jgi:hypothetical protein
LQPTKNILSGLHEHIFDIIIQQIFKQFHAVRMPPLMRAETLPVGILPAKNGRSTCTAWASPSNKVIRNNDNTLSIPKDVILSDSEESASV